MVVLQDEQTLLISSPSNAVSFPYLTVSCTFSLALYIFHSPHNSYSFRNFTTLVLFLTHGAESTLPVICTLVGLGVRTRRHHTWNLGHTSVLRGCHILLHRDFLASQHSK